MNSAFVLAYAKQYIPDDVVNIIMDYKEQLDVYEGIDKEIKKYYQDIFCYINSYNELISKIDSYRSKAETNISKNQSLLIGFDENIKRVMERKLFKPKEFHPIIEHDVSVLNDRIRNIQGRIRKSKREIYMLGLIEVYVAEKDRDKMIQLFDI